MLGKGQPTVVSDRGPVIVWDGKRISGVWLTAVAIDLAIERAKKYGITTVSIRRSGHIACLAAFLSRATKEDLLIELASSDPSVESVAPYGGTKAAFTPNPIAVGIPTNDQPLLIDISASITTNGLTGRLHAESKKYPVSGFKTTLGRQATIRAYYFLIHLAQYFQLGVRNTDIRDLV